MVEYDNDGWDRVLKIEGERTVDLGSQVQYTLDSGDSYEMEISHDGIIEVEEGEIAYLQVSDLPEVDGGSNVFLDDRVDVVVPEPSPEGRLVGSSGNVHTTQRPVDYDISSETEGSPQQVKSGQEVDISEMLGAPESHQPQKHVIDENDNLGQLPAGGNPNPKRVTDTRSLEIPEPEEGNPEPKNVRGGPLDEPTDPENVYLGYPNAIGPNAPDREDE